MCLRACAVLFVLAAVFAAPTGVMADFQQGIPVYSTQPDGSKLELRAWGDEYFQTTETIDGMQLQII
jgi:hypothetical protein